MIKLARATVAMILLAAAACAQTTGANPGPPSGTPPDPQTMIQMRVSFLATLLNLTDAQKSQALTIYTNAFTAAQTLQTPLEADRQNLTTAIKSNNTASIDQLAAAIGSADGQRLAINSKADAAFYALLTADQQTKYDALPHGGPGRGPGGSGGFGPAGFRGAAGR